MVVVTVVHEQVHQRARGKKQPRENPQHMRLMFGKQKERNDC
jgi:hypothetical protein